MRTAVLWRRFMENVSPGPPPAADLFTEPLDPKDPANTPRGLNVSNPKVGAALAKAITDLKARSVLASSQSDDPNSAHHADQTLLFSRKESKRYCSMKPGSRGTRRSRW